MDKRLEGQGELPMSQRVTCDNCQADTYGVVHLCSKHSGARLTAEQFKELKVAVLATPGLAQGMNRVADGIHKSLANRMTKSLEILRRMTWGEARIRGDLCFTEQQLALIEPLLIPDRAAISADELVEKCLAEFQVMVADPVPGRAVTTRSRTQYEVIAAIDALKGRYTLTDAPPAKSAPSELRKLAVEILTVPGFNHHWIPEHLEAALDHATSILQSAFAKDKKRIEDLLDTITDLNNFDAPKELFDARMKIVALESALDAERALLIETALAQASRHYGSRNCQHPDPLPTVESVLAEAARLRKEPEGT